MASIVNSGLGQWILYVLIIGNGIALIVGVLLLACPRCLRWFEPQNGNPLSLRTLFKPIDIMRNTDRWLLGSPKLIGAVTVVSALFILVKGSLFVAGISIADGGGVLERLFGTGQAWPPAVWQVLWQSLIIALGLGVLFALTAGLLALSRFDLLLRWSEIANRWVSPRRAVRPFAHPFYGPDGQVRARPRLWGAVISATALYSFVMLLWLVRG